MPRLGSRTFRQGERYVNSKIEELNYMYGGILAYYIHQALLYYDYRFQRYSGFIKCPPDPTPQLHVD